MPVVHERLELAVVEREGLEHVRHEAELLVAFLEIGVHLRRQRSRRKLQRRDLDVVLGAGMGWSGHLPAFDHRPSPGGNWPFLGGGLYWLGHGRGLQLWKGPILPPLATERYRRSQPALLRFDAAFRRPARFEHPDTRRLKATPDLPTSLKPS